MSTYTQIYYHIVFSTKDREPVLAANRREDLYRYTWGIIKNKKSHLYRINGMEDHLHIFASLHPSVCLADFVKDIELGSGWWIKENSVFPGFSHWQDGYGAFTCSTEDKDRVIEYIRAQQEHHKRESSQEEIRRLLIEAGIEFDEQYLR
jgi:putative transposase